MPLEGAHEKDLGMETADGPVCKYDCKDGAIKDGADIFAGGVAFFMTSCTDGDEGLAQRLTRKNMRSLPYWQKHPFAVLDGAEATDEEFGAAMAKL